MAGWISWDNISLNVGTSVGRTVLESVWPQVEAIAGREEWPPQVWTDRLLAGLADTIISAKCAESPQLDGSSDMQAAITAGEIYANSQFHPGVLRFGTPNDATTWIMAYVRRHPPQHNRLDEATQQIIRENAALNALLPDREGQRAGWGEMTFDVFVQWLYLIRAPMNNATIVCLGLVNYVSGMAKMGQMSQAWRRSRERQIRREAGNDEIVLEAAVAQIVWDIYGVALKPANETWGPLFVFLEQSCRAKGLNRLFVTAQQSAEQGCTVLTLIADAQRQCQDFNWDRFVDPRVPAEIQIRTELRIWHQDYTAMKNNPWIRFSGGAGRSPQMSNLGYLAKQLLTRAKGVTSVENYAGLDHGNLTISFRPWIDRVVAQYIEAVAREQNDEEQQPATRPAQNQRIANIILQPLNIPDPFRFRRPGENPPAPAGPPAAIIAPPPVQVAPANENPNLAAAGPINQPDVQEGNDDVPDGEFNWG